MSYMNLIKYDYLDKKKNIFDYEFEIIWLDAALFNNNGERKNLTFFELNSF
jgi:hypothetical protein